MTTYLFAGLATFGFTTILTVAGLGAAFILVPIFLALGVELHQAMATALLLNAIAMIFACTRFIPAKLVDFRTAVPILIVASILSPLGAYTSHFLPVPLLKWLFLGFLLFAASMMLFYKGQAGPAPAAIKQQLFYGIAIGGAAGYLGGLLGVGGGNFIVPALIWLGFDPKRASATTAFIVIFASLSGFMGQAYMGAMDQLLLSWTAAGSIAGALLGAWLMQRKMQSHQVKQMIGIALYLIAAQMAWKLLAR